jgi:hypothetical protein
MGIVIERELSFAPSRRIFDDYGGKPVEVDWDLVKGAVAAARSGSAAGMRVLADARRQISESDDSEAGRSKRVTAICVPANIINDYDCDKFPQDVVAESFKVLAENMKYDYLASAIYRFSGPRADLAAEMFGAAGEEGVRASIDFDARILENESEDKPGLSPLVCMASFGPREAFDVASGLLARQGRWYDIGEAARRATSWERFREIADLALDYRLWGALINSRHNGDRRALGYAPSLFRDNATVSDVEAAAGERDWTSVGCMFQWCGGEVRDAAFRRLAESGHDYFADEKAMKRYLRGKFIGRRGVARYVAGVLSRRLDKYALMRDYRDGPEQV